VEKCLSSKCHFNLFSGGTGSQSYSFPFRVEPSISVLKEKCLKTLILKASLLAGVYVRMVVKGRKTDVTLLLDIDKKTNREYRDVCLKKKG